jgi:RNA polymerase-binding protein DksA
MTELQTDQFREALLAERERVRGAIEHLQQENSGTLEDGSGSLVSGLDDHMADIGTDTFDRELDYTLEDSAEAVLAQIEAALQRIEAGTYGICQNCGQPISPERLEARPWAELCIDCQRRLEHG